MKQCIVVAVFFLALSMGCATSSQPKAAPPAWEMEKQVTHLASVSGLSLHLLRWGAVEQQEALLLLRGVDHPWADKVVVHQVKPCRHGKCYSTEVNGRPWTTLLLGKESAELYLPFLEEDSPLRLSYVTDTPGLPVPEDLAKMFESQQRE